MRRRSIPVSFTFPVPVLRHEQQRRRRRRSPAEEFPGAGSKGHSLRWLLQAQGKCRLLLERFRGLPPPRSVLHKRLESFNGCACRGDPLPRIFLLTCPASRPPSPLEVLKAELTLQVRCGGGTPCNRCVDSNLPCTRNIVRKKRGPKKGHGSVISRIRAESSTSQPAAELPPTSAATAAQQPTSIAVASLLNEVWALSFAKSMWLRGNTFLIFLISLRSSRLSESNLLDHFCFSLAFSPFHPSRSTP